MLKTMSTVDDFTKEFNLSKTTSYQLIKSGELKVIRIGRCIRIPRESINDWVKQKMAEQEMGSSLN